MIEINPNNYEKEINSDKPLFLCFLSNNIFCKEFLTIIEDLEKKYGDKIRFAYIDAKKHLELLIKNSIFVTPSFVIYYKGYVLYGMQGFREKNSIEKKLVRILNLLKRRSF